MTPLRVYLAPGLPLTFNYRLVLEALDTWDLWHVTDTFYDAIPPTTTTAPPEWNWGPMWENVPLVGDPDTLYFCPCVPTTNVRGCFREGCTVMVCPGDSLETLELRAVHELIHALGLPADDMRAWIRSSLPMALIYIVTRCLRLRTEESWQRLYYRYLIEEWRKHVN